MFYPLQLYIFHQLNLALRESVADISELTIFFTNLTELHTFFNRSFKRTNVLNECQSTNVLNECQSVSNTFILAESSSRAKKPVAVSETRWTYRSRQLFAIKNNIDSYINTFTKIAERRDPKYSSDVPEASGFPTRGRLESFDFNYWIKVYTRIFSLTDALYNMLQSVKLNVGWAGTKVNETITGVNKNSDHSDKIYEKIAADFDPPTLSKQKRKRNTLYDMYSGSAGGGTVLNHKNERRKLLIKVVQKTIRCLNDRELAVTYKRAGLPQKLEHLVLENHEIKLKETGTLDQFARLAELTLTIPLTV
ncbi:hypothetical protein ACHWQZ_G016114 [Mnemiopsis leidyi]